MARQCGCTLDELRARMKSREFTLWAGLNALEAEELKEARAKSKGKGYVNN